MLQNHLKVLLADSLAINFYTNCYTLTPFLIRCAVAGARSVDYFISKSICGKPVPMQYFYYCSLKIIHKSKIVNKQKI